MQPEPDNHVSAIQKLLLRLGATKNYVGFRYIVDAIRLSLEDSQRLLLITKHIYPAVAAHYHTKWMCVEKNIRTIVDVIWRTNPSLLQQIAGYHLKEKPSASQFIAILTAYLSNDAS